MTAFSREGPKKVYVQDRISELGVLVYDLLQQNAHLYVCGNAAGMARDVKSTLLQIISEHGNSSSDMAEKMLSTMKASGRYQVRYLRQSSVQSSRADHLVPGGCLVKGARLGKERFGHGERTGATCDYAIYSLMGPRTWQKTRVPRKACIATEGNPPPKERSVIGQLEPLGST